MTPLLWALHHLLSILSFLLTVIFISVILRSRRAPASTVAWLLVIVLVPYVGIPLYWLIGARKVRQVAGQKGKLYARKPSEGEGIARILSSAGVPPATLHNEYRALATGEAAFHAILGAIQGARRQIHLATFILGDDPVGHAIVDALTERARAGIEVKLLLDGVGTFWFPRHKVRALRQAGGKVAIFAPLWIVPISNYQTLRNHRKLLLVDGALAILGGMNLTQDYMGPEPDPRRWTDFSFSLRGEALTELGHLFDTDWSYATRQEPGPLAEGETPAPAVGDTPVRIVGSGPDVPGDPLYDAFLTQIFLARSRIWIATPYFIPDETLARALELACRRGLDVRILTPARSNHALADFCRASYLKQIDRAGGKLCFYGPTMMHAKLILFDDSLAFLGSTNLDMRSFLLNYELSALLAAKPAVAGVAEWFIQAFKKTELAHPRDYRGSAVLESLGRILGQLL